MVRRIVSRDTESEHVPDGKLPCGVLATPVFLPPDQECLPALHCDGRELLAEALSEEQLKRKLGADQQRRVPRILHNKDAARDHVRAADP